MKAKTGIRVASILLLLGCSILRAGEVVDRIVATVNGHAILESELDEAARYQCLLTRSDCNNTAEPRNAALTRLIEQQMVEQQINATVVLKPTEVAAKISELKQSLLKSSGEQQWSELLRRYGLSEEDVAEQVSREIRIRHYIDGRFRPGARIQRSATKKYYDQVLVPELQKARAAVPSLESVESRINEILAQQEIDDQFSSWLNSLRAASKIEVR
jgi:hypothetical protein